MGLSPINVGTANVLASPANSSAVMYSQDSTSWDQQAVAGANSFVNGASDITQEQIIYLQKKLEHERKHLSFFGFIKKHILEGILERIFSVWFVTEVAKTCNLRGSLWLSLASIGGLLLGEGFVQLEHLIDRVVHRVMNGKADKDESYNPFDLASLVAKTISVVIMSLLGVGKKLWFFNHLTDHFNPSKQDDSTKIAKGSQARITEFLGEKFNVDSKDIQQKLADNSHLNILDTFDATAQWFKNGIGKSKNKHAAAFGNSAGFVFEKFFGCPNMRAAKIAGKPITRNILLKDAGYKLGLLIPALVGSSFVFNLIREVFNRLVPDDKDYVLESLLKQRGLTQA